MEDYLRKGRALNLVGIANAPVKVTVGFKCEGREKIALAHEAHNSAMTLSEYVECLVSSRHEQRQFVTTEVIQELEESKSINKRLLDQLAIYENNEQLQRLLTTHLGKTVPLRDSTGKETMVTVSHVSDVFRIMVNSFKTH